MTIEKALESWYVEGHHLRLEPLHPLLGIAGEAGELLNLYKKNRFKPEFNWSDCKECGQEKDDIFHGEEQDSHNYVPLILDELGDFWYYLRIVAWQQNIKIWDYNQLEIDNVELCLSKLSKFSSALLDDYLEKGVVDRYDLKDIFNWFCYILNHLNCSLEELTELNYEKLNTVAQNGWSSARGIK